MSFFCPSGASHPPLHPKTDLFQSGANRGHQQEIEQRGGSLLHSPNTPHSYHEHLQDRGAPLPSHSIFIYLFVWGACLAVLWDYLLALHSVITPSVFKP